ncbi:hypothetical protein RHOFW510R12_04990 [Rhodanobacter sp. FW510-R12]
MLLHDTEVRERGFGVAQFLQELSERYATFNFQHSNGLGVVVVGAEIPAVFSQFMKYALASPYAVRGYFEALAGTIVQPDGTTPVAGEVVDVDVVSSLYYRLENESFDDQRTLTKRMSGDEGTFLLHFALADGVRPDYIRLDPAEVPGVFHIDRIAIGGTDNVLVPLDAISARLGHVSGQILPGDGTSIGLVGSDNDPYVELSIADVVRNIPKENPLIIEISLRVEILLRDPRLWKIAAAQLSSLGPLREIAQTQIDIRVLSREIQSLLSAHNEQHANYWRQSDELHASMTTALTGVVEQRMATVRSRQEDIHALQERYTSSLLPQQQMSNERLDALDTRLEELAGIVQTIGARLVDLAQQHASQSSDISDHLSSFALSLQQVGSAQERIQAIRDQQFAGLQERQQQTDCHLTEVGGRLDALAALHETTSAQSQAGNAQHALELHGLKEQLDTLIELQQRSFFGRIRRKFSKPA